MSDFGTSKIPKPKKCETQKKQETTYVDDIHGGVLVATGMSPEASDELFEDDENNIMKTAEACITRGTHPFVNTK